MQQQSLIACVFERWRPEIGDPELTGWLTVLIYLLCFGLSLSVWRRYPELVGRGFWAFLTVLLLFLAVNKQLDLQSAMTQIGRCVSQAHGWYEDRRYVQFAFILGLLLTSVIGLIVGARLLFGSLRQNGIALVGLAILTSFVVIRAVGFHKMDALLRHREFGLSTNFLLENTGLALIAFNAILLLRGRGADRRRA